MEDLNKKLAVNKEMKIPKQYVKRRESKVDWKYELPEGLPVKESFKMGYEALDHILSKILDIHIIEPISVLKFRTKAVPRSKADTKSRVMDIDNYMKKLEKSAKQ